LVAPRFYEQFRFQFQKWEKVRQAATIMAAFVYNAAMRDDKFSRKPMPGGQQAVR